MLGATLADWQRKREEEEASLSWRTVQGKRAEAAAREGAGGKDGKKTPGQRAYEKKMKQKRIVGESQALLDEKRSAYTPNQKLEEEETNWLKKLNPVYQYEKRKAEKLKAQQAESQQARDDFRAGEREYAVAQAEKEKQIVYLQKITRTGGLYGPPIIESEITPEEIEDGPPEKKIHPLEFKHMLKR